MDDDDDNNVKLIGRVALNNGGGIRSRSVICMYERERLL